MSVISFIAVPVIAVKSWVCLWLGKNRPLSRRSGLKK
jgi:hypothetical protein